MCYPYNLRGNKECYLLWVYITDILSVILGLSIHFCCQNTYKLCKF